MSQHLVPLAVVLAALSTPTFAATPLLTLDATEAAATAPASDAAEPHHLVSLTAEVDITTAYIFRGYKVQDQGLIVQPSLYLAFNIPQLQSGETTFTPSIGTWNSLHSKQSPHGPCWWYENDLDASLNIAHGNWSLTLAFNYYGYPGGGALSSYEAGASLAYNDAEFTGKLIEGLSINPHLAMYREINRSTNTADAAPGTYYELGIAPSREFKILDNPVTFSLPTNLGLGSDGYYRDNNGGNSNLGYVSAGLTIAIPITPLKQFCDCTLNLSVTYERLLSDSTIAFNHGNADIILGTAGLVFTY